MNDRLANTHLDELLSALGVMPREWSRQMILHWLRKYEPRVDDNATG